MTEAEPTGQASDDDEDDIDTGAIGFCGRDGVIFLIDAEIGPDADQFDLCLQMLEAAMLNRMVQNDKDLMGIMLYNTGRSPAPSELALANAASSDQSLLVVPAHTAIAWPLQVISKTAVQFVKDWRRSAYDHPNHFDEHFGVRRRPANLTEALWLCSRMLCGCDYKLQSANVTLLTERDQPMLDADGHSDAAEVQRCFLRAIDLRAMNVDMTLVPMRDAFDVDVFYRELLCTVLDQDPDTFRMAKPAEQRENMCIRYYQRDFRRACLRHFELDLTGGAFADCAADGDQPLVIGCGIYALTRCARVPGRVQLHAADNQPVQVRRQFVCTETDADGRETERVLLPGEVIKYMEVGGQVVRFTAEEQTAIRSIMAPGMRLLCFQSIDQVPRYTPIRPSRLLYPSDTRVRGSTALFRALLDGCRARGVFALCMFAQQRKVAPRYVALVPQPVGPEDADGFLVIYLPTNSDYRAVVPDALDRDVPDVSTAGVDLMESLVRRLTFDYSPRMFNDLQLTTFYANIEALAYDEPRPDIEDTTLPDVQQQDRRLGELAARILDEFGTDTAKLAAKRRVKTEDDGGNGEPEQDAEKRSTKVARTDAMSVEAMTEAILHGVGLTVSAMRDYLSVQGYHGLTKLKKADLMALIKTQLQL